VTRILKIQISVEQLNREMRWILHVARINY